MGPTMGPDAIIHETGNTQRIATPPEEDRPPNRGRGQRAEKI